MSSKSDVFASCLHTVFQHSIWIDKRKSNWWMLSVISSLTIGTNVNLNTVKQLNDQSCRKLIKSSKFIKRQILNSILWCKFFFQKNH